MWFCHFLLLTHRLKKLPTDFARCQLRKGIIYSYPVPLLTLVLATRTRYSHSLLATRYSLLALELAMRHSHSRGIQLALARARINSHSEPVEHSRVKEKLLVSTRALAFKFHVICTVRSGTHKDLLFWC